MQYKPPVQNHAILNLTPLIDIVFLLLVFFMLTAHFVEEKQLDLKLPAAQSGAQISDDKVVLISIDSQGLYYLDQELVHGDVLSDRLSRLQQNTSELILQLKADQNVDFKKVVHVLDLARQKGITNLEILTEQP